MPSKYEYILNGGTTEERKVAANSYGFSDGFIHFTDAEKLRVFSITSARVATIERLDAKK